MAYPSVENCQHARSVLRSEIRLKEQNRAYKLIRMLVKQSPGLCMDACSYCHPLNGYVVVDGTLFIDFIEVRFDYIALF